MQFIHVNVVHQAFFGHQHGFFGGATNTDTQHARWAPACAHGRHGFKHPINHVVAGVQHVHLALVLRATTFGGNGYLNSVARHDFGEDDGRRVVFGVFAFKLRVRNDGCAQSVVWVVVSAAHTFIHSVIQAAVKAIPTHIHTHLEKHVHDTRVLTNRAMSFGRHFAVGQNLGNRVFGRRALLTLVRACEVGDVVGWVVVTDVLQGCCDGFNQVCLANGSRSIHFKVGVCLRLEFRARIMFQWR